MKKFLNKMRKEINETRAGWRAFMDKTVCLSDTSFKITVDNLLPNLRAPRDNGVLQNAMDWCHNSIMDYLNMHHLMLIEDGKVNEKAIDDFIKSEIIAFHTEYDSTSIFETIEGGAKGFAESYFKELFRRIDRQEGPIIELKYGEPYPFSWRK